MYLAQLPHRVTFYMSRTKPKIDLGIAVWILQGNFLLNNLFLLFVIDNDVGRKIHFLTWKLLWNYRFWL